MNLIFSLQSPHYWLLCGRDGKLTRSGVAEALVDLPRDKSIDRHIGVMPGDKVTIHHLDVPAKSHKLLLQAIPNALEPELASDISDLYFVLLHWIKGKSATVAVVARDDVDSMFIELEKEGIKLDRMVPEYLLLPLKGKGSITVARSPHGSILVRTSKNTGFLIDQEWFGQWLNNRTEPVGDIQYLNHELDTLIPPRIGMEANYWPIGSTPSDWIKLQMPGEFPNTLPEEYRKQQGAGRSSLPWLVLAASILMWVAVDVVEYVHLTRMNQRLDQQLTQTFREMFPTVRRIELGKIRFQTKSELAKFQGNGGAGGGYFEMLDALSKTVRGTRASIQSIDYRKGEMVVYVKLPDYAMADQLKQRFDQDRRVTVDLIPSGSAESEVSARYKIRLAG